MTSLRELLVTTECLYHGCHAPAVQGLEFCLAHAAKGVSGTCDKLRSMPEPDYRLTRASARAARACYSDARLAELIPESGLSVAEVAALAIPAEDRHWALVYAVGAPERVLREHACWCARRALAAERVAGREPDVRSWAAVAVAERYARGDATIAELDAASVAACASVADSDAESAAVRAAAVDARADAWAAARAAARADARSAAMAATWAAARAAAMADARSATWAAARAGWDAAMAATWAAARAGWDAAWDAQLDDLVARLDRSLTTTTKKGESHV